MATPEDDENCHHVQNNPQRSEIKAVVPAQILPRDSLQIPRNY